MLSHLPGKIVALLWLFVSLQLHSTSSEVQTAIFKGIPANWAPGITVDPFVKIGNSFYYIELQKNVNWFTAAHECRKLNGNLVSIETESERRFLENYLAEKGIYEVFWTSANDLANEGDFSWLGTGDEVRFNFWDVYQPDNQNGVENCVHVKKREERLYMNDENCVHLARFICEMNTPTTVSFSIW